MKRKKILLLFGIILLMTGCSDFFMICSLNPFYLHKDIILAPALEGSWSVLPRYRGAGKKESEIWQQMDTTSTWKIERRIAKETNKTTRGTDTVIYKALDEYQVWLVHARPDTAICKFKMVLFKINQVMYADFMPLENAGLEKSRFAAESYFKVHTLARVVAHHDQIDISWLGASSMKEMIEKKRVRVSYRWVSDAGRLLLTGNSEQLTEMISHYAGQSRFIDWENQEAMLKFNRVNETK